MKRIALLGMILILALAGAASAARDISLNPPSIGVPPGGTGYVTATVVDETGPVSGATVTIFQKCEELAGDPDYCDTGDDFSTTEIAVSVTSPTDANGEATVTITIDSSADGKYHYLIKTPDSLGIWGAASTGTVVLPEFTTVGAALVLLGAIVFAIKKRRE